LKGKLNADKALAQPLFQANLCRLYSHLMAAAMLRLWKKKSYSNTF